MGRPRALEDAARGAIVRVRFTEAERVALAGIARDMGLSLSSFARRVLLDRPLPARRPARAFPEVNQQLYLELGRIGANLNEITQRLNESAPGDARWQRALMEALELLGGALADLRPRLLQAPSGKDE